MLQNPNIGISTKLDSGEYQVIVTDVNGCIDSVQTSVIVNDLPIVNVNSNSPVCLADSIKLTEGGGDGTGWNWSGPSLSFSSTLQNPNIGISTKLDSGEYQVIVTDVNGCIDSARTSVIVNDLPIVNVNSNSPICLADSLKLTESGGDGTGWNWSGPSLSFSSTLQNPNIGISTKLDSGEYQVIVTDVNGCVDSAQMSVIVHDLPVINVNSNSPLCLTDSIRLSESGGDGTSWVWSGPSFSFSSTLQNPNIGFSAKLDSGQYQVIVTDVNGCIDTAQTSVIVHDLPIVNVNSNSPVCLADSIKLTEGGGDGTGWNWSGPSLSFSSTLQNPNIGISTKFDSGEYQVIVTDVNGCIDSARTSVIVNDLPIVNVNSNSPICLADSLKLTESGGDGTGWNWSGPSLSFSSTLQNPNIGISTKLDSGEYQVIVTDVNGCVDSAQMSVIVHDLPVINVNSNSPLCLTDSIRLSESGGDGTSWAWSGPSFSFSSTLQNPNIGVSAKLDSGQYQVIVTDVNGCIDSAQTSVIVHDLPAIVLGNNTPICEGTELFLEEKGGGAITWDWIGPNGFSSSFQNPQIANSSALNIGTYQVSVTDVNGCHNGDSIIIDIDLLPIIMDDIIGPPEICLDIVDISYSLSEVADATNYTWTYSISESVIDQDGNNTASFPSIVPGGELAVVASNNCGASLPVSITIVEASPDVCSLATCFRKNTFVDNGLTDLLGHQLIMKVSEVISANMSLNGGGSARFIAGEAVDIYPGFKIAEGAILTIEIEPCELLEDLLDTLEKE